MQQLASSTSLVDMNRHQTRKSISFPFKEVVPTFVVEPLFLQVSIDTLLTSVSKSASQTLFQARSVTAAHCYQTRVTAVAGAHNIQANESSQQKMRKVL